MVEDYSLILTIMEIISPYYYWTLFLISFKLLTWVTDGSEATTQSDKLLRCSICLCILASIHEMSTEHFLQPAGVYIYACSSPRVCFIVNILILAMKTGQ